MPFLVYTVESIQFPDFQRVESIDLLNVLVSLMGFIQLPYLTNVWISSKEIMPKENII